MRYKSTYNNYSIKIIHFTFLSQVSHSLLVAKVSSEKSAGKVWLLRNYPIPLEGIKIVYGISDHICLIRKHHFEESGRFVTASLLDSLVISRSCSRTLYVIRPVPIPSPPDKAARRSRCLRRHRIASAPSCNIHTGIHR